MREPRLLLRERRPFVRRHVERRKLAPARFERLALRGRRAGRLRRRIALLDGGPPFAPRTRRLASERGEPSERVNERSLHVRRRERLMRMLAMEVDQALADLLELRECRLPAVDPCAAPAIAVERATQQERLLI